MSEMNKEKIDVDFYHEIKSGEKESGDSFFYAIYEHMFICVIADGLGSGQLAKESSEIVVQFIKENPLLDDQSIVALTNKHLFKKRGVVLGILRIQMDKGEYVYSSIGNIGLIVIDENNNRERNIPKHGYLSNRPCELKQISGKVSRANFILYSDGVSDNELTRETFQYGKPSQLIETFKRHISHTRSDDTTLIAIQYNHSL